MLRKVELGVWLCFLLTLIITLASSVPSEPGPGQRCAGRNYNGRRCCTPEQPCDEGEGDCDGPGDGGQHDGHAGCKGDLVCGSNNCLQFGEYYHPKDDCCERPVVPVTSTTRSISRPVVARSQSCSVFRPCREGEADCDDDKDCEGRLVCGNNNCHKFGPHFHHKDDCCEKPTTLLSYPPPPPVPSSGSVPTQPRPGQRCAGRNYNGRRCCTPEQPCQEGEGDCDGPGDGGQHDGHRGCVGDLQCGSNNCLQFGLYYHPKDDCCERSAPVSTPPPRPQPGVFLEPPPGEKCSGRNYHGKRCCTPESPCDVGQGDCDGPGDGGQHDGNRGCMAGLVCGTNNCLKFGAYFHPKDDCCEQPDGSGGWGGWGAWSACSKSCGSGHWSRDRYCRGPGCPHTTASQTRICNSQPCKSKTWTPWSKWSTSSWIELLQAIQAK